MQDGSFSLPASIIPNDGIIEAVPAGNANEESIQQLGENSLEDDGILALLTTGKLVDKLKNGKVDEVSSLVKEVVAKGIDDEDIGKLLAEVITLLVDLSWDENKKSTSSKSGKSSKKSSDDPPPITTTPVTCSLVPYGGCGSDSDCCTCKCIQMFCYSELLFCMPILYLTLYLHPVFDKSS